MNRGGVADAALGGWQLGSILTLQTGFPYTVVSGRDQSNTGAGSDRPNATGQYALLSAGERNPERWFNSGAFVLQPFGTHGNVGRNTIITPGLIQWDFSVHKEFRILENHAVQFRFEAFNFPNHPNWGNPEGNLSSSSFGKIRTTRTNMRELQLALKYMF
jgi:hypothetical protein